MARLTIPDEQTYATFTATAQTVFPISFALLSGKPDLRVSVAGIELGQSDFTFSGTLLEGGGYQGGSVTLNTAATGQVIIWRDVAPERASQFAPSNTVPVRSVDMALNRAMAIAQDARRDLARALLVGLGQDLISSQDVIDAAAAVAGRATTDLQNVINTAAPEFGALGFNPATPVLFAHQPTGNVQPQVSIAGILSQKTTVHDNYREIGLSLGMVSNKGALNTSPLTGNGDKITAYLGNKAQAGAYNVWALNTLTEISAGATSVNGAWSVEIDLNNFRADVSSAPGPAGMGGFRAVGLEVTGASSFQCTAAYVAGSLTAGKWNRGFVADSAAIRDVAFADYSNAITTLDVWGNHTNIIDLTNATIAGKILKSPFANIGKDGDAAFIGSHAGYMGYVGNARNNADAKGLRVDTTWAALDGRALEVFVAGVEYFRIDGNAANPLWVRVGNTLRNVIVDGSGFLKVV